MDFSPLTKKSIKNFSQKVKRKAYWKLDEENDSIRVIVRELADKLTEMADNDSLEVVLNRGFAISLLMIVDEYLDFKKHKHLLYDSCSRLNAAKDLYEEIMTKENPRQITALRAAANAIGINTGKRKILPDPGCLFFEYYRELNWEMGEKKVEDAEKRAAINKLMTKYNFSTEDACIQHLKVGKRIIQTAPPDSDHWIPEHWLRNILPNQWNG